MEPGGRVYHNALPGPLLGASATTNLFISNYTTSRIPSTQRPTQNNQSGIEFPRPRRHKFLIIGSLPPPMFSQNIVDRAANPRAISAIIERKARLLGQLQNERLNPTAVYRLFPAPTEQDSGFWQAMHSVYNVRACV